jgi:uncharacterized Ntn-hydrolase superfamily protein
VDLDDYRHCTRLTCSTLRAPDVIIGVMQRLCFRFGIASGALAAAAVLPNAVLATYSIAATDSQTQEIGGAITSCVGSLDVGIVYGSLPGVGVIHAQAQLDQRGRAKTRAIELLEEGIDPSEIIAEITRRDLDQAFASRQYGIVDLSGRAAGFTGEQAQAYKNDQQGKVGTFTYSVQGNILTSQAVLDQTAEAFQEPACDLAERLMRALEAGADNGEGDSRCTGAGIPSDSAFIQVDRPGQSEPYLQLNIAGTRPDNPLPQLRAMFDAWRATHPCSMPSTPAAGSGGSAGAGGAATMPAAGNSAAAGMGALAGVGGAANASSAGATANATAGRLAVAGSAAPTSGVGGTASPSIAGAGAPMRASTSANRAAAGSGTTSSAISESPAAGSGGGCIVAARGIAPSRPAWLLLPATAWLIRRIRRHRARGLRPSTSTLTRA